MKKSASLALCAALLSAAAHAELNSQQRLRAYAKLPNWYGIWEPDNRDAAAGTANATKGYADITRLKLGAKPPYNAEWEAKVQASIARADQPPTTVRCSFGFPAMMDGPGMFQVLIQPEETIILQHGYDVRHVYTDGRKHPTGDDIWPTPIGDSIGHWEGQTLVIDTIARKAGPLHLNPYYQISEKAHFVERMRLVDADTLEDQMTVEDPDRFARPLVVTMHYQRVKDLDRVLYSDCSENDRNPVVDGKVIIAPPKP